MTVLIRNIDTKKWTPTNSNWLKVDDIEADPIGDLKTTQNTLSVFEVEDESLAIRVVAAILAQRTNIKNVGYAIIPLDIIENRGFKLDREKGTTPDKEVNEWHRNIIELSGNSIVLLARTIREDCEYRILFEDNWVDALNASLKDSHISADKIQDKTIRKKLGLPTKL